MPASAKPAFDVHEWLLYLATQQQRNTNLILMELRRMATNDAQLTQAVTDLIDAYDPMIAALDTEISNLKSAVQPQTDTAITDAVAKIQGVVAQMKQASAAAQLAVTPAPATTPAPDSVPDPTPASSPSPSASTAAGSAAAASLSSSPAEAPASA